MGGIRREFGAVFGPAKSIRAEENLFAWHSTLLQLSRPASFARLKIFRADLTERGPNAEESAHLSLHYYQPRHCAPGKVDPFRQGNDSHRHRPNVGGLSILSVFEVGFAMSL
jgi:hypothetical protein